MTVRIFYIDESFDDKKYCLCAIGIRHIDWRDCFGRVRQLRTILKDDHGMFIRKEIHAHEFVSGRGRISDQPIVKWHRSRIFDHLLSCIAQMPHVMLFNICLDVKGRANPQMDAWDRLLNRIERTMLEFEGRELQKRRKLISNLPKDLPEQVRNDIELRLNSYRPRAILIADEGREQEITKSLRKMSVFNPIPSAYATWEGGKTTKNVPVERVIEDPIFKKSHQSCLLKQADCVCFALLKREVSPTPNIEKYGIHKMFDKRLADVCYRPASRSDPLGIVRK